MCISQFVVALFLLLRLVLKQIPKTVRKKEIFIWTLVFRNLHLWFRTPLFSRPELKKNIVGKTYGGEGTSWWPGSKRSRGQEPGKELESLSPGSFLQPVPRPEHCYHLTIKLSKLEFVNWRIHWQSQRPYGSVTSPRVHLWMLALWEHFDTEALGKSPRLVANP